MEMLRDQVVPHGPWGQVLCPKAVATYRVCKEATSIFCKTSSNKADRSARKVKRTTPTTAGPKMPLTRDSAQYAPTMRITTLLMQSERYEAPRTVAKV